ncbi:hypothetical protein PHMEG_00034913 [Phytophthora megakarya]|uniref:Uncharacterized protein n=1 Tax=Phytophthora megakarya TaxID=4795 RepID=A0A225UQ29_9STRA|nr:hypothetical protein PHMEG_00034913 [Phytophthora megakarya]
MTNIIRTHGLDVASAARLARGESQSNPRPNKALCHEPVFRLLAGYEHRDILVSIM